MRRGRKAVANVTMEPEILAAARAKAAEENRSLSNFVETIVKEYLEKCGEVFPDETR